MVPLMVKNRFRAGLNGLGVRLPRLGTVLDWYDFGPGLQQRMRERWQSGATSELAWWKDFSPRAAAVSPTSSRRA